MNRTSAAHEQRPHKWSSMRAVATLTCAVGLLCPVVSLAMCGQDLDQNAFRRPLDYNNAADAATFHEYVDSFHFTKEVEALVRGKSSDVPGDLAYSLRQMPNHHRALYSMMRWQLENGRPRDAEERLIYTMDCYFDRALTLSPNDAVVYMLQAIFYQKQKKYEPAATSYQKALELSPESAEIHYNYALLLIDQGDYRKAKEQADQAYALGSTLPGLKRKLQQAGY
jgi:tetratricopeptide (TPR) repeat protein